MSAIEQLSIADRAECRKIQDFCRAERADRDLQAAEHIAAPADGKIRVIAVHGRAPPAIARDTFKLKAGQVSGHPCQASFDVFGQFESVLRMQSPELLLVHCFGALGLLLRLRDFPASLDRSLELLFEIHEQEIGNRKCAVGRAPIHLL